MKQTLSACGDAEGDEVPIAAVIVHPTQGVVAQTSSSSITQHDPTAHAEILAIRHAAQRLQNYRLTGCTIYTSLEPCFMCFYALMHARIARIVFSASDLRVGVLSQSHYQSTHALHNHHFTWTGGVLSQQSQLILKQFFSAKR